MKKFPLHGQNCDEIKVFVEDKDVLSIFDNKRKIRHSNKEKRNYIRKTNTFLINNKSEEKFDSKTNEATPELKTNIPHIPVYSNLHKPFSLTNNTINTKHNIIVKNNNYYNQNKLFKPIETKLNYNVYDDLVCYYENSSKKLPNQNIHKDENNEYFRIYKFSNASTVANNTDSRSNEEKLLIDKEDEDLGDLKILMPSYNNYDDMNMNSFIPNNFGYDRNNDVVVKLEEDAFEKFFDFK
jgi:hypothetical protein